MDKKLLYTINMAEFEKAYPQEAEKYKGMKINPKFDLKEVESYGGGTSLMAKMSDGKEYLLQGVYGKDDYGLDIIKGYGRILPMTPLFCVGLTQINFIKEFSKAVDENCLIVVYEPSLEVFDYMMHNEDMTPLFGKLPATLYIEGIMGGNFVDRLMNIFTLEAFSSIKYFISPNYKNICHDEVLKVSKDLKEAYTRMMTLWNTAALYTDVVTKNMLYNLRSYIDGYNVSQLKGMLKKKYPAFIISAGPSLNKNIDELKRIKGRAVIIAVDTAIKPLLNHGIKPDFFCIVDGKKPTELMNHPGINEIPLVTSLSVASGIMDLHKGKKFFYGSSESFEDEIIKAAHRGAGCKDNLIKQNLSTGGSVANTAFALAHFMDAKELILVGQDLALTNGRTHADGTFKEKMDKLNLESDGLVYFEVEGIHGNKVITRNDFDRYRLWFEEFIEKMHLEKIAIDATQGGAKIHGARLMTLRKAIDTYCKDKVDMKAMLDKLPKMMDYGAKKATVDFYYELADKVEEVSKMAAKGERAYRKFARLVEKEDVTDTELIKCAEKIKKVNDYMNSDEYALFVQAAMIDIDYVMRMSIYDEKEDEKEERTQIAKEGILLNGLIARYAKGIANGVREVNKRRPIKVGKKDVVGPIDKLIYELSKEAE